MPSVNRASGGALVASFGLQGGAKALSGTRLEGGAEAGGAHRVGNDGQNLVAGSTDFRFVPGRIVGHRARRRDGRQHRQVPFRGPYVSRACEYGRDTFLCADSRGDAGRPGRGSRSARRVVMDSKRLLVGTLVGAVMISIVGFLLYEVIFAGFFEGQMVVGQREAPIIWAAILSALAHGLLLTMVIGWAGDASMMGGLKTGAIVGLLLWLGADMILFGVFEFATLTASLADTVLATVQYGLAGAAIGAVAAKSATAAPEAPMGGAAPRV